MADFSRCHILTADLDPSVELANGLGKIRTFPWPSLKLIKCRTRYERDDSRSRADLRTAAVSRRQMTPAVCGRRSDDRAGDVRDIT